MFPLGTVVFPHSALPLRIFEPRYRQLTRDCLAGAREFGVVLIARGSEVGGGDQRTDVGTLVSIIEAQEAADGQWGMLALATRRIRVVRWLPDDPYPRAEVEDAGDGAWSASADRALEAAERAVRRSLALLAELDEPAPPVHVALDPDPTIAAWQLASISPLGPLDRQRLLAVDAPEERLAHLAQLVDEECAVLAARLAGS